MGTDRGPLESMVRFLTCEHKRGVRRGPQASMWIIRSQRMQPFLRVQTGSGHSTGMARTSLIQRFPFCCSDFRVGVVAVSIQGAILCG